MEEKFKIKRNPNSGRCKPDFLWLWNNENSKTAKVYFEEEEKLKEEIRACGECVCRKTPEELEEHMDGCIPIMVEAEARTVERLKDLLEKRQPKSKAEDNIVDCPIVFAEMYP